MHTHKNFLASFLAVLYFLESSSDLDLLGSVDIAVYDFFMFDSCTCLCLEFCVLLLSLSAASWSFRGRLRNIALCTYLEIKVAMRFCYSRVTLSVNEDFEKHGSRCRFCEIHVKLVEKVRDQRPFSAKLFLPSSSVHICSYNDH